jgi:translation initiation factor 3 subunit D
MEIPYMPLTGQFGPSDEPIAQGGVPYAHYSKGDKLGRVADWTQDPQKQEGREGRRSGYRGGGAGGGYRDQYQSYGAGQVSMFGYQHDEDEATFSIVDSRSANKSRLSGTGKGAFVRTRGTRGGVGIAGTRGGGRGGYTGRAVAGAGGRLGDGARGAAGNTQARQGWGRGGRRGGWKDYDMPKRMKESSVSIKSDWKMLEEIEFNRLGKLNLEASEATDIETVGTVYYYNRSFDKLNTKAPKPFQTTERFGQDFLIGTLEDPTIEELARQNTAKVYATDTILSMIMCAPRSVNPWDILVTKQEDALYFDKRTGSPIDLVSVNENALEPPPEAPLDDPNNPGMKLPSTVPKINTAPELREEAFYIVSNFAQQVVTASERDCVKFTTPVPFEDLWEDDDVEIASRGYRYRTFDLSLAEEEEPLPILVRTEVDAVQKNANGQDSFLTIKALNEWGSGAPGQIDWRTKLDSQRGAVVATEMKNNSCKLARWAVQSILAGSDLMKLGYVLQSHDI